MSGMRFAPDLRRHRRPIRRHIFFIPGYDAMTVAHHLRIFRRESARFGDIWSVEVEASELVGEISPHNPVGDRWDYRSRGPDWAAEGTYEVLSWQDICAAHGQQGIWAHITGTLRAIFDSVVTGTLFRYLFKSWRYFLFYVFSYAFILSFAALAIFAGMETARLTESTIGGVAAAMLGVVAGIIAAVLLERGPMRRMRLWQSLGALQFLSEYPRGCHPALDTRISAFAHRLREVEAAPDAPDEILLVGHSLGTSIGLRALAEALEDPAFGTRIPVRFLTLGNAIPVTAFHPGDVRTREAAQKVAAAPQPIGWLEIQSRDDVVSSFPVDPVTLRRCTFTPDDFEPGRYPARPTIRHVPVLWMLTLRAYLPRRFDIMRTHCQSFLAGDKRSPHDFHAYVSGPLAFDVVAASSAGLMPFIGPDGGLILPQEEPAELRYAVP